MEGNAELDIWRWRIYADVSLLRYLEYECDEYEIVLEERSALQIGVVAFENTSSRESAANDVVRQLLR